MTMKSTRQHVYDSNKLKRPNGQGLVEYALILALVAIVVVVTLSVVGPSVGNIFSNVIGGLRGGVITGGAGGTAPTATPIAQCQVKLSSGTYTLPASVRNGASSGQWNWIGGGNTLHLTGVSAVWNPSGWTGAVMSATGDCSPFGNK